MMSDREVRVLKVAAWLVTISATGVVNPPMAEVVAFQPSQIGPVAL